MSSSGTDEELTELEVHVAEVITEADGVVSLAFSHPDGGRLPDWEPGAHLDLMLPGGLERQYSLCGDPADPHCWRVAVLREPEGRGGSAWIHDNLRAGETLTVRGPRNNFPLIEADRYVFVAGGIGITPLVPMIAAVAAAGVPWQLLYGGRRRSSMAFVDHLARHGELVRIWPEDEDGLLELDSLFAEAEPGTAIYCCGPEALIAAVEDRHAKRPDLTLRVERFRPAQGALEGETTSFEVVLDRSGLSVQVGADETILEAVEAAGVSVPTSCREGTCGSCETEVLEGEVEHRDVFMTPEEHEETATMQICCSRARSPRLVLDL
jgi:ferredoxin-NADP reductase